MLKVSDAISYSILFNSMEFGVNGGFNSVKHWALVSKEGIVGFRGQHWSHSVGNQAAIRRMLGTFWTIFRDMFVKPFSGSRF